MTCELPTEPNSIGRGRRQPDPGRQAARVLLYGLQVADNRSRILSHLEAISSAKLKPASQNAVWCLAADSGLRDEWQRAEPWIKEKRHLAAAVDGIGYAVNEHVRMKDKPALAAGALPLLCAALRNGNAAVRRAALDEVWTMGSWGKLPVAAALPEVDRALADSKLKIAAVRAIDAIAETDKQSVAHYRPLLEQLENDPNSNMRVAAADALRALRR